MPTADVKPPELPIEKGAALRIIRPAKFVDPDQNWWDINAKKFIETTGIPVNLSYTSWEDLRPQTAVIANTGGGADVVIGFASAPVFMSEAGRCVGPCRISRSEIRRLV